MRAKDNSGKQRQETCCVFRFMLSMLSMLFDRSKALIVAQPIKKRMHDIDVRMQLEKISGISIAAKEAFLAYCQEQERADLAIIAASRKEEEDIEWDMWEDFGNWHNSPIF